MIENITDHDVFKKMRKDFEEKVKREQKLIESKRKIYVSPSGKYTLVIDLLEHPTNPKKNCTVGNIYRANNELITTVYRNHPLFIYTWIEVHPSGHPYMLCGFDIQGQTVIELDTGIRKDFMTPEALMGKAKCWANYVISPLGSRLLLESCYIGGSIMTTILDFTRPMEGIWPEIGFLDIDDEPLNDDTLSACTRNWISETELEISYTINVRKSDGKHLSMLKESVREKLETQDIAKKEIIGRWISNE